MLKKQKLTSNQKLFKKITMIIIGALILSVGLYFFNVPSNIAAGGVTGFSQVIDYLFPQINLGLLVGAFNFVLFILGYFVLGKEFGLFTMIGAGATSIFLAIFDAFIKMDAPILKDNIANLVIGAALVGISLSIVFTQNASTGGTDVIAKIIEKHTDFSVSTGMMIIDTLIIVFATTVFGLEKGIYSFMSLFITAYVLDALITGFNSKIEMTIISKEIENINEYIRVQIFRGTTLYKAKGGYTKQDKDILVTVVDKKQYIKIRNYIKNIDEDAFVYVKSISEVIGYGFSREFVYDTTRENTKIKN